MSLICIFERLKERWESLMSGLYGEQKQVFADISDQISMCPKERSILVFDRFRVDERFQQDPHRFRRCLLFGTPDVNHGSHCSHKRMFSLRLHSVLQPLIIPLLVVRLEAQIEQEVCLHLRIALSHEMTMKYRDDLRSTFWKHI